MLRARAALPQNCVFPIHGKHEVRGGWRAYRHYIIARRRRRARAVGNLPTSRDSCAPGIETVKLLIMSILLANRNIAKMLAQTLRNEGERERDLKKQKCGAFRNFACLRSLERYYDILTCNVLDFFNAFSALFVRGKQKKM